MPDNVLGILFQDIADAIRAKTGGTDTMKPVEFPTQIAAIPTGGGGSSADVRYVTFIGADGATLIVKPVAVGDDCVDVAAKGLISTPTKESTVAEVYTYSGWSLTEGGAASSSALKNVTEDRTVYAAFTAAARTYAARFYNDAGELMQDSQVAYGTQATPPDTKKDGYVFKNWTPSDLTIYGDTDFVGEWQVDEGWLTYMPFTTGLIGSAALQMEYTPDGTKLIVYTNYKVLYALDATVQPYKLLYSKQMVTKTPSYVRFKISPSGEYLAIYNNSNQSQNISKKIELLSIGDKYFSTYATLGGTYSVNDGYKFNLAFSPDGSKLYGFNTYNNSGVFVWDTQTWSLTQIAVNISPISNISPDGNTIFASNDGTSWGVRNVRAYDITNDFADVTDTYFSTSGNLGLHVGVACSPDGQYVAYSGNGSSVNYSQNLKLYKKNEASTPLLSLSFMKDPGLNAQNKPAFTPDSEVVTVPCGKSPYIISAETATGTQLDAPKTAINGMAYCCAYSPDGTRLAIGTGTAPYVCLYEVRR